YPSAMMTAPPWCKSSSQNRLRMSTRPRWTRWSRPPSRYATPDTRPNSAVTCSPIPAPSSRPPKLSALWWTLSCYCWPCAAPAPLLAIMIGLAVGIDYALFIVSRHREQLGDGVDPEESAARAVATAGSAVIFAGVTVMIALLGLAVANIPFLTVMGIVAAGAV